MCTTIDPAAKGQPTNALQCAEQYTARRPVPLISQPSMLTSQQNSIAIQPLCRGHKTECSGGAGANKPCCHPTRLTVVNRQNCLLDNQRFMRVSMTAHKQRSTELSTHPCVLPSTVLSMMVCAPSRYPSAYNRDIGNQRSGYRESTETKFAFKLQLPAISVVTSTIPPPIDCK